MLQVSGHEGTTSKIKNSFVVKEHWDKAFALNPQVYCLSVDILTASNNLINKIKENDDNSSNYILTSSNNLINKIKENDDNSSIFTPIGKYNYFCIWNFIRLSYPSQTVMN